MLIDFMIFYEEILLYIIHNVCVCVSPFCCQLPLRFPRGGSKEYLPVIHANSITSFLSTKGVQIPRYIIKELFCFWRHPIQQEQKAWKVSHDRFLTENFLNVSTSHLPSSPITSLGKVTGWILLTSSVLYALFHYDAYFLCFLSHGNTNSLLDCVISNNEGKISNPLFYFCVCSFH